MTDSINWGVLAPGKITRKFATGVLGSKTGKLVAVGSRDQQRADEFAKEFNVPTAYDSYEKLLADKSVDAVYIATPHPFHAKWIIAAAQAGKHVLCEKPIALNASEAMVAIEAARENDIFLMEAFMYRCHPQMEKLVELIKQGAIGQVKVIQSTFGFGVDKYNSQGRLDNPDLGGGGILDVGCYPVSFSRLVAGAAQGKGFADPIEVKALGKIGETGIDDYTAATLKFDNGIIAQVATSVHLALGALARVVGSEGQITVPEPWQPGRGSDKSVGEIILHKNGQDPETITIDSNLPLYAYEVDTVAKYINQRQADSPAMSWADTLGNMKTLDLWRKEIGLQYPRETEQGFTEPVQGGKLTKRSDARMPVADIAHLDKKVSKLIMGTAGLADFAQAAVLYDYYFQLGGNGFDTSFHYGASEPTFGKWIKSRGIRDEIVILGKGAHTPNCYPEALTEHLHKTLDQLNTDYLDIYALHRDNPDVPVGEFIDVLNEHLEAGRIKTFGGSNWTAQRIDEANEYAKKNGKQGFDVVSNNFSLATMLKAPWAGCLASSTQEFRNWHKAHSDIALLPWSSQAQGFFTDRCSREKTDIPMLVNSWYNDQNFDRKQRAEELGAELGVHPTLVALAYVLNQPFPVFPLVGPRTLDEVRTCVDACFIEMDDNRKKWLESGE